VRSRLKPINAEFLNINLINIHHSHCWGARL